MSPLISVYSYNSEFKLYLEYLCTDNTKKAYIDSEILIKIKRTNSYFCTKVIVVLIKFYSKLLFLVLSGFDTGVFIPSISLM